MTDFAYYESLAQELGASSVVATAGTLHKIGSLGMSNDLYEAFVVHLKERMLPTDEVDRIIENVYRFLDGSRSPQSWLALFDRDPDSLQTLLRLFSTSQYMANVLIADPEAFDLLQMTSGMPVDQSILLDEILAAIASTTDSRQAMRLLRDYRHRETLRVAYGDFVCFQSLDTVTEQLSLLAEAIIQAAITAAEKELYSRRTRPIHADGSPVQFVVVAFGKLGGGELNYSSDVDLLFIYEAPRLAVSKRTFSERTAIDETFQRLGQLIIKYLSESTPQGIAYRVDAKFRPHGVQGPLVSCFPEAFQYYDTSGRTWERQVFIKGRAIAGDIPLGEQFLIELQPWIYRRYLTRADITGVSALKRRIERRSKAAGVDARDVKWGHGGIHDIEYVIQFLQLLNGGEDESVRCTGTLAALHALQSARFLSAEEEAVLAENYRYLRRIEHIMQIMYDRHTHSLPADLTELARVAVRMGQGSSREYPSAESFLEELDRRMTANRRVLDHLLNDNIANSEEALPETDLVLDPEPPEELIRSVLEPHGFQQWQNAYRHLQQLAVESIPFLSTRRCRHFLAAIAPQLLAEIGRTPSPDATLISLANVSESLGSKTVLWELFSANAPSMQLCVRLCACSPYLAGILTSNPGMIDELMDSLIVDRLPTREQLAANLAELCRNAVDITPILYSFKNSMNLKVGVRDILGKIDVREAHAALSDIAEVCLEQVIHHEFHRLVHQIGIPMRSGSFGNGQPAELVVLAVGKLGGREPNYHSDLDVIFLYDSEGSTCSLVPNRRFEPTTNRHFFNQLSQRVIQAVTRYVGTGRLYDLDVQLRPMGRSGELAITIADLREHFREGGGQVWERQTLCKARPIWGSPEAQASAMQCVQEVLTEEAWDDSHSKQLVALRFQRQEGATDRNLKRSVGGTLDVEFITQLFQLRLGPTHPEVLIPGTLVTLEKLKQRGLLNEKIADDMFRNYSFLRSVESGIRLLNATQRHDLPTDPVQLERLAYLLAKHYGAPISDGPSLVAACDKARKENRSIFLKLTERWQNSGGAVRDLGIDVP